MTATTSGQAVPVKETVTLPPTMAALQKWRNADHEDHLTLNRDDVIMLIEEETSSLLQARADAAAAVALMVERAEIAAKNVATGFHDGISGDWHSYSGLTMISETCKAIRALAPDAGTAELAKLRQNAKATNGVWQANLRLIAERDRLAAEVARLKAQEAGEEGDLNSRLKSHGLLTIDEVMQPFNRFQVHAGMTDMDKLIAAVEAGTATMNDFASVFPSETAYGPTTWGTAHNAFSGSLDAALRLHEALLPGWRTGLRQHDEIEGQGWFVWLNAPNYRVEHYHAGGEDRATVFGDRATADANTPARAWLLAALKALKANTGTGGE